MAESLEALNEKWHDILFHRQQALLEADHETQEDENHSTLYFTYYQEILEEVEGGTFFQSGDVRLTDRDVDRKIAKRLEELHRLENETHEEYTSNLKRSPQRQDSLDVAAVNTKETAKSFPTYKGVAVEGIHVPTAQEKPQVIEEKKKNKTENKLRIPPKTSIGDDSNEIVGELDTNKFIGASGKDAAFLTNKNSNQMEEHRQQLQKNGLKNRPSEGKADGNAPVAASDVSKYVSDASDHARIRKDERTRETRLLERINKEVDYRLANRTKKDGRQQGGCGGGDADGGWFSWLNCGVEDRDGDSD